MTVMSSSRVGVTHTVTVWPAAVTPLVDGKIVHRMYGEFWRFDCDCEQGAKKVLCKHVHEALERIGAVDLVATLKAAVVDSDGDLDTRLKWVVKQARIAYRVERDMIRKTLKAASGTQKVSSFAPVEEDVDAKSARDILVAMTPKDVRALPREAYMALLAAMGRDASPTAPESPPVPEGPPIPEAPPVPDYVQQLYDVL